MRSSTVRIVRTTRVARSELVSTLVRLMMAVNDLSLVNNALKEWDTSSDRRKHLRKGGGRMFFVRVQMAYVFEALGIIKEIWHSADLMAVVEAGDRRTAEAFAAVSNFIDSNDYKLLAQFRNSAGFHYDGKRAERAVKEIAEARPADRSPQTLGSEPLDWHFELGDNVFERIVVRYIFGVPDGADIVKEFDV